MKSQRRQENVEADGLQSIGFRCFLPQGRTALGGAFQADGLQSVGFLAVEPNR
jgi:hypothetical protein